MNALYSDLHAWLAAMLPSGVTVYVRDQNAPTPANPRVTMRIAAMTDLAHYRDGVQDNGAPEDATQRLTRWTGFTLALEFYGASLFEAETLAADMLDLCRFDELRIEHLGRTATFNRVLSGPTSIDGVIGAQFEPRVSLDLAMSATRERLLDVGPIETVQVDATVGGHDATFIVP